MILNDKDKQNLIDALKEWEECVGPKELNEEDVGLNHDRYVDLMRRLGVTGDIENNFSWDMTDEDRREELKYLGYPRGKDVSTGDIENNFARLITAADTVGIWSDAGRNWGAGSKFEDAVAAMGFDIDEVRELIEKARSVTYSVLQEAKDE